jgi:3-oxoacyl-[acyl-carrier-protein] synthase III
MRRTVIHSTGSYLPETIVHNEDLDQFPDNARYLISQKTGVFARRRAGDNECTSDLAAKAAQNCLDKCGLSADAIDGVIVSTSSPDRMQPATATRVQYLIKACNAFAFDINSVCSGSTYGIAVADALIRSGQCDNVLFIGAEVYSKILDFHDFSTLPYFGDGAGAMLLGTDGDRRGVLQSVLSTEGSGCDVISVPGGGTMLPYSRLRNPADAFFRMKGKLVFEFAVSKGSEVIQQLLDKAGVAVNDIKCFLCHQANVNIITGIARKIQVPARLFYINLFRYGNMASASVLIALDEALSKGVIQKGDLVMTVAFGGGLSWGANLIEI